MLPTRYSLSYTSLEVLGSFQARCKLLERLVLQALKRPPPDPQIYGAANAANAACAALVLQAIANVDPSQVTAANLPQAEMLAYLQIYCPDTTAADVNAMQCLPLPSPRQIMLQA